MLRKMHVFRILPEEEIIRAIEQHCQQHQIHSGVVLGIIGSVQSARLSFLRELPGKYETEEYPGPLEIVCAQGSVALKDNDLIVHVHMQLSGRDISRGGHLSSAVVFSTAEVVLGELDFHLRRCKDEYTGLNELQC